MTPLNVVDPLAGASTSIDTVPAALLVTVPPRPGAASEREPTVWLPLPARSKEAPLAIESGVVEGNGPVPPVAIATSVMNEVKSPPPWSVPLNDRVYDPAVVTVNEPVTRLNDEVLAGVTSPPVPMLVMFAPFSSTS